MTGGTVVSKGYGLCVDGGTANVSNATIKSTGQYGAVLVRNTGSATLTSTTITGAKDAVGNETVSCKNLVIRNRATNYGITGLIGGNVIATTNTGPGQAQEKVTIYNLTSTNILFPTWTEKNGQDDIDWMHGTYSSVSQAPAGQSTVTIYKSKHNNETGIYNVHVYAANSSWTAEKGLGGIQLTF